MTNVRKWSLLTISAQPKQDISGHTDTKTREKTWKLVLTLWPASRRSRTFLHSRSQALAVESRSCSLIDRRKWTVADFGLAVIAVPPDAHSRTESSSPPALVNPRCAHYDSDEWGKPTGNRTIDQSTKPRTGCCWDGAPWLLRPAAAMLVTASPGIGAALALRHPVSSSTGSSGWSLLF